MLHSERSLNVSGQFPKGKERHCKAGQSNNAAFGICFLVLLTSLTAVTDRSMVSRGVHIMDGLLIISNEYTTYAPNQSAHAFENNKVSCGHWSRVRTFNLVVTQQQFVRSTVAV